MPHLIWWANLSKKAIDALDHLRKEKLIEPAPAHYFEYLADGVGLDLPIAKVKNAKKYKTDHWLLVKFYVTKKQEDGQTN